MNLGMGVLLFSVFTAFSVFICTVFPANINGCVQ